MKVASVRPFFNAIIGELLFTKEDWTPCRRAKPSRRRTRTERNMGSITNLTLQQSIDRSKVRNPFRFHLARHPTSPLVVGH